LVSPEVVQNPFYQEQDPNQVSVSFQQVYDFLSASPFFSRLDDGERRRLVREFDLISLSGGQVLYRQREPAGAVYFVLEGRLLLKHMKNRREVSGILLQSGDPVGEEAFTRGESYQGSVTADSDAILLRIRGDRLRGLIDQYPRLAGSRNLLSNTAQLSRMVNLDWLNRDERVVLLTRRHPFFFFARAFSPGLIAMIGTILLIVNLRGITDFPQPVLIGIAVLVAAVLVWIFWVGLDWSNDYYILTTHRLVRIDRTAGLFDRRDEVPLGNIMAVEMSTTALAKMFGFADITSRTYNVPVVWHGIANPALVVSLVESYVERGKASHAGLEMDAMQAALEHQIDGVEREAGDQPSSVTGVIPSITFRKHWIILLRKTWLPFTFGTAALFILTGGLTKRLDISMTEPVKWMLGVLVMIFFIWYLYQFLDWNNDIYQVTSEQVMDVKRTPLGREDRKAAMLENILSINYHRRGLMGVLLNYGMVNIQVGTESLIFDFVRDPSSVQREIFRRMAERQAALRQVNIDSERDRMSQWITAYHRRIND
jgi:uncharacterized membrane protein YdbT with pleckstrin-like domain